MKRTYRLEFSVSQQHFHLDNYTHEENTHGWITILDNCSDMEFHIFESYINRKRLDILTNEFLLKSVLELKTFMSNLMKHKLAISPIVDKTIVSSPTHINKHQI